jgi:hypothetical protein
MQAATFAGIELKPEEIKPLSDKEIYDLALADWYSILASLWIAVGKSVEEERLKIYGRELGNVPCELLERAIRRIHLNSAYNAVPSIGEIWKAVQIELANDNCSSPEEWIDRKWENFMWRSRMNHELHP